MGTVQQASVLWGAATRPPVGRRLSMTLYGALPGSRARAFMLASSAMEPCPILNPLGPDQNSDGHPHSLSATTAPASAGAVLARPVASISLNQLDSTRRRADGCGATRREETPRHLAPASAGVFLFVVGPSRHLTLRGRAAGGHFGSTSRPVLCPIDHLDRGNLCPEARLVFAQHLFTRLT